MQKDRNDVWAVLTDVLHSWIMNSAGGRVGGLACNVAAKFGGRTLRSIVEVSKKLHTDFDNGATKSSFFLKQQNDFAAEDIKILNGNTCSSAPVEIPISPRAWSGEGEEHLVSQLKEAASGLGRPICVSVPAIYSAAVSSVFAIENRKVPLEICFDEPTGKELATSSKIQRADFIISPDAPFFLNPDFSRFRRINAIGNERQTIFRKTGKSKRNAPVVWVYPGSTVELQMRVFRQKGRKEYFGLPPVVREEAMEFSDFEHCGQIMADGDFIFGWEPFQKKLMADPLFELIPDSDFHPSISMFCRENLIPQSNLIDCFFGLFLTEWNRMSKNRLVALLYLIQSRKYRHEYMRLPAFSKNH